MVIRKGYKQTELGMIPEDWIIGKLEDFFSFISYGFTNPMPTTKYGISLITATDIDKGEIQLESARYTTIDAYNKLTAKSKPKQNDILLTKDGTLGRLALVDNEKICINQSVAIIRPNYKVVPLFLKYLLESPLYQRKMIQDAGGSTIKHIYITIVNLMKIAIPKEKTEQIKIAEILNDLNKLIRKYENLIQKKKNIKQGAMQELLTGKRRLKGFCGKWGVEKIYNMGKVIRGASPRPKGDKRYYGGNIPRLMVEDVSRDGKYVTPNVDFLTKAGEKLSRPCKKGTLTIVCSGTVGIPSFLAVDACIHDGFLAIIGIQKNFSEDYLFHQLSNLRNKFETSATHGGVFTNLTTSILEDFEVDFPPTKEEQIEIAKILSDMDNEIKELEKQLEKYTNLKQAMMQKLLTGEIRLV